MHLPFGPFRSPQIKYIELSNYMGTRWCVKKRQSRAKSGGRLTHPQEYLRLRVSSPCSAWLRRLRLRKEKVRREVSGL
jgi:hypothetical protein